MKAAAAFIVLLAASAIGAQPLPFHLPKQQPPVLYGSLLIRRATRNGSAKSVAFSHWSHRVRYTCRVCHLELDFAMQTNSTEITEDAIRRGAYCGACHNGKIAFAATEANCPRCHTGSLDAVPDGFFKLLDLPHSRFGNTIDWSRALADHEIAPAQSLAKGYEPLPFDKTLSLDAEWNFVSPATFPHRDHVRWLDCANCHPEPFNIKKKTTKHFSMRFNLAGEFCGRCHLRVAFPLDDCQRCHPEMKERPLEK